jgi:hypothetical protein
VPGTKVTIPKSLRIANRKLLKGVSFLGAPSAGILPYGYAGSFASMIA